MWDNEKGITLLEQLLSLTIIVLALTVFVTGLSVGGSGVDAVRQRVSSENLARTALEQIKAAPYTTGEGAYEDVIAQVPVPASGYSLSVATETLATNLQLVTVTVKNNDQTMFVMEEYKRGP